MIDDDDENDGDDDLLQRHLFIIVTYLFSVWIFTATLFGADWSLTCEKA